MSAQDFLDRVYEHIDNLPRDKFNYRSWRFEKRPTSEGVGILPTADIDVEAMVSRILDVQQYPGHIRYVESVEMVEERTPTDFTYIQRLNLPLLGGLQMGINLSDYGDHDGYRVIAWDQNDGVTDGLDKKHGGARTQYNLGAWLLKPEEVLYALSSAPRKEDVGSLKFAVMTKGADATAGDVLKSNIEGMIAWSQKA